MRRQARSFIFSISRLQPGILLVCLAVVRAAEGDEPRLTDHRGLLRACEQAVACSSHLENADKLYKQGLFSVAIEEYQAAYILQPYPPILYNIARLHHKQNHLAEAVVYYQRYLDSLPEAAMAARVGKQLAAAQRDLAARAQAPAPAAPVPAPVQAVGMPAPATPALAPTATAPAEERHGSPAIYKKWWFWTLLGIAALGTAAAVGVGINSTRPDASNLPAQTFSFEPPGER